MSKAYINHLKSQLQEIEEQGLYKREHLIASPQGAHIHLASSRNVLNFCANNYLGLANHPKIVESAKASLDSWGFGLASVRFICGTQTIHKQLEERISQFFQTDATILYGSCFDANGGLFETLLGPEDAVISDALNHASVIDGIRLCKAERFRYKNNDMTDLEARLKEAQGKRFRMIATDGVFSMDGIMANLKGICDLADRYDALVMVDDCHAAGFIGEGGRGSPEACGVLGRIDIITGTLGKALGGATGGFTTGRKEIIDLLRQRSRPYLFSNTLAPAVVQASLTALDLVEKGHDLRKQLHENAAYFREKMTALGFRLVPGNHPIIPVMLGDAKLAQEFAKRMLERGVFVVGFFYPVVPKGEARIRTQMSAILTKDDLDTAIDAFRAVGKELL